MMILLAIATAVLVLGGSWVFYVLLAGERAMRNLSADELRRLFPSEATSQDNARMLLSIYEVLSDLNEEWFLIEDNERRVRMQNALGISCGFMLEHEEES